jgi:hypothetical protein
MPMRRRSFLTSAGLGALTPLALASQASAAEWSDAEKANVKLVNDFCASWSTRDLKQVLPRFADTGVYRMSETTPPVTGHAGITERLGSWMQSSDRIVWEVLDTYAKGPMVIRRPGRSRGKGSASSSSRTARSRSGRTTPFA